MSRLWKTSGSALVEVSTSKLNDETRLEDWLEQNPDLVGPNLLVFGRQVLTAFGGWIDLLALNQEGDVMVIELKRQKTPRETVAQVLDYASWVKDLTAKEIHQIASDYIVKRKLGTTLQQRFFEKFDTDLPEQLNTNHSMLIVASALDEQSQRIVKYLAEVHDLNINTAFFNLFKDGEQEFLAADWLMDPDEVEEKSIAKRAAPWQGLWYVNVGEGEDRAWKDCTRFGFISAGGGRRFSGALDRLEPGDRIVAYQKKKGYVGYGIVKAKPVLAKDFKVNGKPILEADLSQPGLAHDQNDAELSEYVVAVDWKKTVPLEKAVRFPKMFANQNVVCKLRDVGTQEVLKREFGFE